MTPPIILASTSLYRRSLLSRLGVQFEWVDPKIDETPSGNETPKNLAVRLAGDKAKAVAGNCPADSVVIGSDQCAALGSTTIGKPGTAENAHRMLTELSGQTISFYTAVSVLCGARHHCHLDVTEVRFRELSAVEISRYVEAESPLDCAGAFKCEGLGISLFESINNQDPTALEGLPLIAVARMLRNSGLAIP